LTVTAARDVTAPEATQLINNWLYRGGRPNTAAGAEDLYNPISPLAWWVQWANFRQTLGSFGGGDLTLTAGRDLVNVQAVVPTQGWADSLSRATASIQLRNAANLTVRGGRDVLGGQYLVGSGEGRLDAAGTLGAAVANARVKVPVPVLMDGSWRVTARTDLNTAPVLNPMALVTATDRVSASSDFYLWGPGAGVSLLSRAGTVATTAVAVTQLGSLGLNSNTAGADANLQVVPPSLVATAGGGGLNLAPAVMLPAPQSTLALWAAGDLQLNGLVMADNAVADWPTARRPVALGLDGVNAIVAGLNTDSFTRTGLHASDRVPVQMHAQGSINGAGAVLALPKAANINAGLDVINLYLSGQNLRDGDSTQVTAGRDVLATLPDSRLSVAGPGSLDIQAGRNIDLGASAGVSTTANQKNPSLPAAGANINLRAAAAGVLDVAAFEASYLTATSGNPRWQSNRQQVLNGVRQALVAPQLTDGEAWAQFQALPAAAQAQLGQRVLAAEFSATYLAGTVPTTAQMTASLAAGFDQRKAQLLQAAESALASGGSITLPGREVLQGDALASYVKDVRAVNFASIELGNVVAQRIKSLQTAQSGWRDVVAKRLGSTPAALDALPETNPAKAAWTQALADTSSRPFEDYRRQVLVQETGSAAAAASQFGRLSLPLRLALFDQGFQVAELAGVGSFTPSAVWPAGLANSAPSVAYSGRLDMTQSSAITERGGSISLINPGGAINVGLKELPTDSRRATGVITLRGGDVFGLARDDFQVNTQRVFIVGQGDMTIWSSKGDIDSGRGANTAVAAPPLQARRSIDGVVYEIPSTTTGSGLGILANTAGERAGAIGLYPALGEILALDAFIRAPSVVLGSSVRGADNLQAAAVSGTVPVVVVPAISVPAPAAAATSNTSKAADTQQQQARAQEQRQRNGMLTVELLGIGAEGAEKPCEDKPGDPNRCK
jgi:filamentous hemagglutinin